MSPDMEMLLFVIGLIAVVSMPIVLIVSIRRDNQDGVLFSAVALGVVILNVLAVVVAIIRAVSYLIQRDYRKAALTALGTISGSAVFVATVVGLTAII